MGAEQSNLSKRELVAENKNLRERLRRLTELYKSRTESFSDNHFIVYRNKIEKLYNEETSRLEKSLADATANNFKLEKMNANLNKTLFKYIKESKQKRIGTMQFIEADRIATGSSGNIVFSGKLLDGSDGRKCAIKRIPINREEWEGGRSVFH